jgi:hypothetical protein
MTEGTEGRGTEDRKAGGVRLWSPQPTGARRAQVLQLRISLSMIPNDRRRGEYGNRLNCTWFGQLLAAVCLIAGCSSQRDVELIAEGKIERPPVTVTVFFADGMDYARMQALLDAGRLPNIQRHFVDGGVGIEHAVAALPPITYANAVSIITGRFPGHHDVTGNRWYDPRCDALRDYGSAATYRKVNEDFHFPTIYEMLGDAFTVNVQGHTRRGVSQTIDNVVTAGLDWLLGNYMAADARVGECVHEVATIARRQGRWPVVYFNYFPGLDEVGHLHGSDSPEYAEAMVTVDAAIGRIVDRVEAMAPADLRYYVLLSDHGHVPTPPARAIDLATWLARNAHLHVYDKASVPLNPRWHDDYDAVLINGAFRRAAIHLFDRRANDSQDVAPAVTWPWIRELAVLPGIAAVCGRCGRDAVEVYRTGGTLRIERRELDGIKAYRIAGIEGDWPGILGEDNPQTAGMREGWHDSRTWLAATANASWPDFVPQVVEMFDSPRTGDLVVFSDNDFSFSAEWRGGHGSCLQQDMHVPLFLAGPGLPPGGQLPAARLVDVAPTMLDLLDVDTPAGTTFDGVSLLPALRTVRPPGAHQPAATHRAIPGS